MHRRQSHRSATRKLIMWAPLPFLKAPLYSYKKNQIQRLLDVREAFGMNGVAINSTTEEKIDLKYIIGKSKSSLKF